MKIKYFKEVQRQGMQLNKLSRSLIKSNPERITIYRRGKFTSWIAKKEYRSLLKDSEMCLTVSPSKKKGFLSARTSPITLEKKVWIKIKGKTEKRKMLIHTYTSKQREFIVKSFKERKLPIDKRHPHSKTVDLKKEFKHANIKYSKLLRDTP